MNTNELALWGKALQALLKLGAIDEVKEIVDEMAELNQRPVRNKAEQKKADE